MYNIESLMKIKKVEKKELSEECGIDESCLSDIIDRKIEPPLDVLTKISVFLKTTPCVFLCSKEDDNSLYGKIFACKGCVIYNTSTTFEYFAGLEINR